MAQSEKHYRTLKKKLNQYHQFSFSMPPKGKNFTPQQKAAITKAANKLEGYIYRVGKEKASFIKKPKGYSLKEVPQALHTNKGIFYPSPGAKIEYKKVKGQKKKKAVFVVRFKEVVEKYFPFPSDIIGNMEKIRAYVEKLNRKYKPEYILWAVNGFMGKVRYSPEAFDMYQTTLSENKEFMKDHKKSKGKFLTGVFLGYQA